MIDYLPKEVAQDILLRVPIKSLVKCTAVCNSWRSMIKNRDFICTHLKHTIEYNNQNGTHLLLLHSTPRSFRSNLSRPEEELCSLHYDNHAFDEYCKVEFPIAQNLHNGFLRVVGICNGLVFLADDYLSLGYTFIICNPSVRKSVTLPKPSLNFATCGPYSASMGFGFHAETNDYKVVRLVTDQCNNPTQFEVYSLATGSWSSPRIVAPRCYIPDRTTHIFVNGAIHWEARNCILSFDVGSELFRKIMMPKCLEHGEWWRFQICLLEDGKSLSLLVVDNGWTSLDIWVLKEYCMEDSWTKLITLSTQLPESSVAPSEPLCFMKCGEIVYVMSKRYGGRHTKLVSLDIVSKQFKDLGSREYPFHYAYSYEESLLLLDRPDAASY